MTAFARRRPIVCAVSLAALHIVLAAITFLPQPHTGGDNAAYVTLARSLLENGTYTELWDPALAPHTKYPPVFPAIIAAGMAAGLKPWAPLKLLVIALSAVAVAFTFLWVRARRRAALALGIGLVVAVAPGVLNEGRWLLSDVPFWAFTMVALWAFERLRNDDWARFGVAAAATLLAMFTRSAGLPLVIAAFAWLGWRGRWKQLAALVLIIGVPTALWALRSRLYGPAGYTAEFWLVDPYNPALGTIGIGDLLARIVDNGWKYMSVHLPILLTGGTAMLAVLVALVLSVLAVAGWALRVRAPRVAELFTVLYIGLILVWPAVWSGERFLLPALPLILYYAAIAVSASVRRVAPRFDLVAAGAIGALLVAMAIPGLVSAAGSSRECVRLYRLGQPYPCLGPVWDEFLDIARMTPRALPDDAVVLNRKPRLFYTLGGGTRSSIYPFSQDPADFFATADSTGARYVVYDLLGATAQTYLRPVLLRKPDAFCIMHVTPLTGAILFGIRPDHADVADRGQPALSGSGAPQFALCDANYWRNAEAMQTFGGG